MCLLSRHTTILSGISNWCLLLVTLLLAGSTAQAEVCVWRNPERTMKKIFPEAGDYKTITLSINDQKRELIEQQLGQKLTSGERKEWIYYKITDKKAGILGYIVADAEKGEYGAIELVMGITPGGQIEGIYVQRSRERDKEFKSKEFLGQFVGKSIKDHIQIGDDIKGNKESVAAELVVFGVRKLLIFYDKLTEKQKSTYRQNEKKDEKGASKDD